MAPIYSAKHILHDKRSLGYGYWPTMGGRRGQIDNDRHPIKQLIRR